MRKLFVIRVFCGFLWRVLLSVGGDAFGQRVAMDTEDDSGVGEVLLVTCEGFFDVKLFEFGDGLIEKDVAF